MYNNKKFSLNCYDIVKGKTGKVEIVTQKITGGCHSKQPSIEHLTNKHKMLNS